MADRTPSSEQRDPLAGDWSEGLPGPSRPLGFPVPQPLFVEAETAQPARPLEEPAAQPPAEVETPDAWGAAAEDPLQSAPPPAQEAARPDPFAAFEQPSEAGSVAASEQPAEAAGPFAAFEQPPAAPEEDEIVELGEEDEAAPVEAAEPAKPAEAAAEVAWDGPGVKPEASETAQPHEAALLSEIATAEPIVEEAAAEPIVEEAAAEQKPQPPAWEAEPPPADWSTFSKGPDWSAPAPAAAPAAEPAWGAPAEPAQTWSTESAWAAPAGANPAAAEPEWSAPRPPPPEPAGWTSANNTLLQMESEPEPVRADPDAAQELFGSVPVGGSLSEDDENELPAVEELEDPDLPVPVEEEAHLPAAADPGQPEARDAPRGLRVPGEHRVAVHTRGGSTKRGVVRNIDLSQPAFALEPAGGGEGEPVQHDDVKAIFFMLPPGESARPGGHGRVKVTFADGRAIEGERDGAEDANGFFLVPQDAARTNTWRIYVAREATTEIRDL